MILAFESSCDETAVAILKPPCTLLSNQIASQHAVHAPFGGVVPELAARRHMEVIAPMMQAAFTEAGIEASDITGVAATHRPGLIGALLVGLSFAKAYAWSRNLPFIGVSHIEAHLNAIHLEAQVPYPHLGVVVSGGHTLFFVVRDFGDYDLVGGTRDDAVGEAFDKVAKVLNLGYPGGPIVDKLSETGNADAYSFVLPRITESEKFGIGPYDVSFSGLKTAVALEVKKTPSLHAPNLVASFQKTAVAILLRSISQIVEDHSLPAVVISGGVAANRALRNALNTWGSDNHCQIFFPSMSLCVDNAAMIAYTGWRRLERGERSPWDLNAAATGSGSQI